MRQHWCLAVLLESLEEQFGLDLTLLVAGVRFREFGPEGRKPCCFEELASSQEIRLWFPEVLLICWLILGKTSMPIDFPLAMKMQLFQCYYHIEGVLRGWLGFLKPSWVPGGWHCGKVQLIFRRLVLCHMNTNLLS